MPAPLMKTMPQSPALAINHFSQELKGKWMELSGGAPGVCFSPASKIFSC